MREKKIKTKFVKLVLLVGEHEFVSLEIFRFLLQIKGFDLMNNQYCRQMHDEHEGRKFSEKNVTRNRSIFCSISSVTLRWFSLCSRVVSSVHEMAFCLNRLSKN